LISPIVPGSDVPVHSASEVEAVRVGLARGSHM